LYEVVDLDGRLLKDERPKVWDLCDELGALLVERCMESFGLADYAALVVDAFLALTERALLLTNFELYVFKLGLELV